MKTFKFSLVALVATVLFAACSNEVAVETIKGGGQEISFRLQGGTPEITTRSLATTLANVDAFAVYGTDDVLYGPGTLGLAGNIFNGITVARQVGGGFDYNPKKYYSDGVGDAEFFAYSPVSAIANITNIDATELYTEASFDYEVVVPDISGNTTQEDLLVAGISVGTIGAGQVSLDFTHALSRIFVKATNTLSDNVVITGLTLKNLCSTGTITGTPTGTPDDPWGWAWANQNDTLDYSYILAPTGVAVQANVTAPTLVTSMEQGMMVLPQATVNSLPLADFNAGDFALEVTYNVANLTGQIAHVLLPNAFPFEANTQYAITITFSGSSLIEISFTIDVLPFDDDSTYPL